MDVPGKNRLSESDEEKAESLLKNFPSVFTKEPDGPVSPVSDQAFTHELDEFTVAEDMVKKNLKSINVSKSPGPDEIHLRLLSETANVLAKPLSIICNNYLRTERLPDQWKDTHISAILKTKGIENNLITICL